MIHIGFNKAIVITLSYTSQYSLWYKFRKADWYTNPKSVCKGFRCIWNGIIAGNGQWLEIFILDKTKHDDKSKI